MMNFFWRKPTARLPSQEDNVWLPKAALANGIRIIGASGCGKTQLGAAILYNSFLQRRPFLVFDPTQSLIKSFLARVAQHCTENYLSAAQQDALYHRIIYCDLSGRYGYVVPFSLFRSYGQEPLSAVADRVINWVSGNFAASHSAPVEGFSSIVKTLYPASIIAAALQPDVQVTELPTLLRDSKNGDSKNGNSIWKTRLSQVADLYPTEAVEAVVYFEHEFNKLDKALRERRLNLLEVVLQPFRYSLPVRATFGASSPGLDFEQIIEQGQMVLIDASGLAGEYKQQVLNWILLYTLPPFLRARGSGHHKPIGVMIDEIATFYMDSPDAMAVFANRFGDMVHVLRRQYGIHPLCVIHQSLAQLHEQIAAHLAALGNQIVGKPADYDSAVLLAEQLFAYESYVKRWDPVFMNSVEGPTVIDWRPQEFTRQEVQHQQALTLQQLKKLHFLTKLTRTEGGGQGPLRDLDITSLLGPWPNEAAIEQQCRQLAAASGVPIAQALVEINTRAAMAAKSTEAATPKPPENATDSAGYKRS